MNRDGIIKTAYTYWDAAENSYFTTSSLDDTLVGDGETEGEAFASFLEAVDIAYDYYKQGKHSFYNAPGRPKRHKAAIHIEVKPDTKERIKAIADKLGISQGDAVDWLAARVQHT